MGDFLDFFDTFFFTTIMLELLAFIFRIPLWPGNFFGNLADAPRR
jgi:hypothetical protein